MEAIYLAVENDLGIHERESLFWQTHNISSVRVSTMNEAIIKASQYEFYFIGINAANVNYMPKLIYLRSATIAPIFISTTNYSMQEQGKAIKNGADLFGQISDDPRDNFDSVMAAIERINERAFRPKSSVNLIVKGNVLISHTHRKLLVGDIETELTGLEFDLLYILMNNPGRVFTSEQLYQQLWSNESLSCIEAAIKNTIARIRRKLGDANMIENVYGVGYKFPSI